MSTDPVSPTASASDSAECALPRTFQLPERIAYIPEELVSQDNLATADPMYVVQQRLRIYNIEGVDDVVYLDEQDLNEVSRAEAVNSSGELRKGFLSTGCVDVWQWVTVCFTRAGAENYLRANGHNLISPRIFVASGYRNAEWIDLRTALGARGDR